MINLDNLKDGFTIDMSISPETVAKVVSDFVGGKDLSVTDEWISCNGVRLDDKEVVKRFNENEPSLQKLYMDNPNVKAYVEKVVTREKERVDAIPQKEFRKYKKGDKVIVKSDLRDESLCAFKCIFPDMLKYQGMCLTVSGGADEIFSVQENVWSWHSDWVVPFEEPKPQRRTTPPKPKPHMDFKVGDMVKVRDNLDKFDKNVHPHITQEMLAHKGKVTEITNVSGSAHCGSKKHYQLKDAGFRCDGKPFSWLSEWLEPYKEKTPPRSHWSLDHSIEFNVNGRLVWAIAKREGGVIARGRAKCSVSDDFDLFYGKTLALDRLILKLVDLKDYALEMEARKERDMVASRWCS